MFQIEFDAQEIQTALPDYRYVSRLGSGAFATVHLVANRKDDQQIALKKINCFGMGEYQKSGAINQVRILGSLQHKNIIQINSCLFDNSEDVLYIFMEYACHGDLTHLLDDAKQKRKRIPQATVWRIINDISDGLQYLHKNQILHRDIKPANIFRSEEGFKIGDMNVSKIMKNGSLATTKTGSPLYTSPQVWENTPYNQKCDIWSLGILAYELCCLKVPFEADSIDELVKKIKNQKVKTIPPSYSNSLLELMKKMLEINPKKRISAEDIFKVAQEKLRINSEVTENGVESMMDTIIFPETDKRWVNLIPLPPRKERADSVKREKSKQNKKESGIFNSNSNIFSSEKRSSLLPRSRSKNKSNDKSVERIPRIRLPSIQRRNSSHESERKSGSNNSKKSETRQGSCTGREKKQVSSSKVNKKLVNAYISSAKKLARPPSALVKNNS